MQLAVFISFFFSVSSSFSLLVHLGLMTKTQPLKDQEKETNDQKCKEQILQPAYMQLAVFLCDFQFLFGRARGQTRKRWGRGQWGERKTASIHLLETFETLAFFLPRDLSYDDDNGSENFTEKWDSRCSKFHRSYSNSSSVRGTRREYSSKLLKHIIVERILVFKRQIYIQAYFFLPKLFHLFGFPS